MCYTRYSKYGLYITCREMFLSSSEHMKERNQRIMQNDNLLKENFEKMNPEQQKAIKCTEGPLLILAGAGSGKTTVLVNRIANIIHSGLARPYEILAITFTNKAANELKSRITNLLSDSANDIWASTFHSTCARILRIYADRLGFSKHFSIYDTDDSKRLIKEVQRVFEIDDKILSHKSIMKEISRAKDNMISVNEYIKNAKNDSRLCEIAKVYETYQNRLKDADAMDFDDIIYSTVLLLNSNQDILEHYQNQFKYVLVDEYQDTNFIQYEFIRLLSLKHHNLCVVGDDDQSIYKFRGATIDNILNFEKTFANTKIIKLEQNYRSTQIILDAANAMIKNNNERKGKNLWTENKNGEKISVHTAVNEQDEAEYIAQQILDFVSNGKKFSDFAVLYRMNSQSNTIERIFAKSGIPYKVVGGMRFYDRKEIKDILSYMSVIANHSDDTRLRRIINYPKRSIGSKTLAIASEIASQQQVSVFKVLETAYLYPELNRSIIKTGAFVDLIHSLTDFAKNPNHSLHEIYETIIQETKIIDEIKKEKDDSENRIQNINELASNILQYEKENPDNATLSGFLEEVSLLTDLDSKDDETDRAVLMTMHSAKGLEFPVVFLPGFEDGIFPGIQTIYNSENMEEERRLAYVGITRAKEKLYIIKARTRMLFGSTSRNKPSRFLQEIPVDLTLETESTGHIIKKESSAQKREREAKFQAMVYAKNFYHKKTEETQKNITEKFSSGESVAHKVFGNGIIVSCTPVGNDNLLEIRFDKAGTKKILSNYAKLKKISSISIN